MATFKLPKNVEDIQEPELLPEDWYRLRISTEPKAELNKAKTGSNIVLEFRVVSDNPEYNGRGFKKWLSLPSTADEQKTTAMGGTVADFKSKMIAAFVSAFNGEEVTGDEINLDQGMEAMFYVVTQLSQDQSREINALDDKNAPRPVE